MIRLEQLSKDYTEAGASRTVLKNCTYTFDEGRFYAIRGRSGSGKSTLLNLLAGIDSPSAGEIYIRDVCVTKLSPRDRTLYRRDNIGFVFQFFNLIPTLTVLENIVLPAELANKNDKATTTRAMELLERVTLADRKDVFPDKLSGGEQQRVAICRAILQNPPLILADEPTGNLDAKTGDDIMALLSEITHNVGRTLIMVTHSRQIAAKADVVLTIHEGQIVEEPANGV